MYEFSQQKHDQPSVFLIDKIVYGCTGIHTEVKFAVCLYKLLYLPKWKLPTSKKYLFQQTQFYKQSKPFPDYKVKSSIRF